MQPERMRTTVTVYERKQAQRGEEAIENQHPRTPEAEQGGAWSPKSQIRYLAIMR